MTLETESTAMPDITDRLRRWTIATDAVPASDLMDEAAAEIERLREAILRHLAEQDATLSVQGGSVTVTMDATLTDAEREAIDTAEASLMRESTYITTPQPVRAKFCAAAATLRGLLERTRPQS